MKFKSLLLVVGFIPALAMAEIAKPAPEKAPPVGARPAVVETQVAKPTAPEKPPVVARPVVGVTHVYHHHYHYGKMGFQSQYMWQPQFETHHHYQSGPPQISGKPRMEGGAREEMMPPEIKRPEMIFPPPYYDHQYHWRRME